MEGIRDGQAVDTCFYCALLYPDLDSCPKCSRRLRYDPARMMNAEELEERTQNLLDAFQKAPGPGEAEAVLRLLHQYADEIAIQPGLANCPSIATLRLAYETAS